MEKQNGRLLIHLILLLWYFFGNMSFANTKAAENENALPPPPPLIIAHDPYEPLNRKVFSFNEAIDNLFLKPISKLYNAVMPKPLNYGIHNIFNNLNELPTIANDILQLHFYQMSSDMWRFTVNSTLGIGGFFDVASRINLPIYSNDFGLTLAYWGYQDSTYMVWPFFGPSTIRDGIGIPVDYYAFSIYGYIRPQIARYAVYGLSVLDRRAQLLLFQPVFEEAAIDRYIFLRNAYLQRRNYQIEKNKHLGTEQRPVVMRELSGEQNKDRV